MIGMGIDLVDESEQQIDERVSDLSSSCGAQRRYQGDTHGLGRAQKVRPIRARGACPPLLDNAR
jgi:hypothetical protein